MQDRANLLHNISFKLAKILPYPLIIMCRKCHVLVNITEGNLSVGLVTTSDKKTRKYTFYIYGFHNGLLTFCLHLSDNDSCMQIFSMIEQLTKIPTKLQMLSYIGTVLLVQVIWLIHMHLLMKTA